MRERDWEIICEHIWGETRNFRSQWRANRSFETWTLTLHMYAGGSTHQYTRCIAALWTCTNSKAWEISGYKQKAYAQWFMSQMLNLSSPQVILSTIFQVEAGLCFGAMRKSLLPVIKLITSWKDYLLTLKIPRKGFCVW